MEKVTRLKTEYLTEEFVPLGGVVLNSVENGREVHVHNEVTDYLAEASKEDGKLVLSLITPGGEPERKDLYRGGSAAEFLRAYEENFLEKMDEYEDHLVSISGDVKNAPLAEAYEILSDKKYHMTCETPKKGHIPKLRISIEHPSHGLAGYLDCGNSINCYSGNHYFDFRSPGESSEEGMEDSPQFEDFYETAREIEGKTDRVLVCTLNYGKYGDPRAYDIFSLIHPTDYERLRQNVESTSYSLSDFDGDLQQLIDSVYSEPAQIDDDYRYVETKPEERRELSVVLMNFITGAHAEPVLNLTLVHHEDGWRRMERKAKAGDSSFRESAEREFPSLELRRQAGKACGRASKIANNPYKRRMLREIGALETFESLWSLAHELSKREASRTNL